MRSAGKYWSLHCSSLAVQEMRGEGVGGQGGRGVLEASYVTAPMQQAFRSRTSLERSETTYVTTPDQKLLEGCCSKRHSSFRPDIAAAMLQQAM